MESIKLYIEQLFKLNKIDISAHQAILLDSFITEAAIIENYNLILQKQSEIMNSWNEKLIIENIKAKQVVIPNATAGKYFEYVLDLEKLDLTDVGDYTLTINENTCLTFDKETHKISGTPKEWGEYELFLNFKLQNAAPEKPYLRKAIKIIINPDPKSLWKDLVSNQNDPYWKADNSSAHALFGEKKLILGSKRGRSHAHEGIFRDDHFKYFYDETTQWGIIAVADGAGSAKYSRKGSAIACDAVVEYFKNEAENRLVDIDTHTTEYLNDKSEANQKKLSTCFVEHLGKAAFSAQAAIRVEATTKGAEAKDFATTLLYALIKKYNNCFVIVSFWVGDGGMGIYNRDKKEIQILGIPDSGEFAGQTRFLTMNEIFANGSYINRIKFKIVEDFTALILMTDGITDPKFQTDANLNIIEKWNDLWEDLQGSNQDKCSVNFNECNEETEIELMNWLDFWSAGNHDDRTIAILY